MRLLVSPKVIGRQSQDIQCKVELTKTFTFLVDASAQGDMPKSGYSANSQAKVAAMAVRGALTGSKVFPAKFSNTCWSLIDTNDGVKVGAHTKRLTRKLLK